MRRRNVGQRQINVETTLCISTLKFTTSNNVESTLCISTLTWTTLDNNVIQPTDSDEIANIISTLNMNKSSGPNSTPYKILNLLKKKIFLNN